MLSPFPFRQLHDWYQKNGRHHLPWRDYNHDKKTLGYRVWLSETMLQQTQVERVKIYFENILAAFPTVEDLAKCSYEDFFPYYKGLGYYSRARNMLAAAKQVVDEFEGVFPEDTQSLRTLKGVGPYTAEAIRAFAYNNPTLSFDTNLEKIFSRYYFGNKLQKLSKEEKEELLEQMKDFCRQTPPKSLSPLLGYTPSPQSSPLKGHQGPKEREKTAAFSPLNKGRLRGVSRNINNALMDYGATISLNSIANIDWDNYPLPSSHFYQTRGELEPVKEKKVSSFPNKQAYILAILHENHKVYFSEPHPASPSQGEELTAASSLLTKEGLEGGFSPFLIGKNTGNPRSMTQSYFLQNFGLEVSVRPPEVKSYNKDEIPYMVCYCQIQSGENTFTKFEGLKVRGFEEGYVEEVEFGEKF